MSIHFFSKEKTIIGLYLENNNLYELDEKDSTMTVQEIYTFSIGLLIVYVEFKFKVSEKNIDISELNK